MELERLYHQFTWNIMSSYGKTYSLAARYFPRDIRQDVAAFYAFVRIADEIVDDPDNGLSEDHKKKLLLEYKSRLLSAIDDEYSTDPVVHTFAQVIRKHSIETSYIDAFIDSMSMDVDVLRYQSFDDLKKYTYGSAEIIGLVMTRIMGVTDKKTLQGAASLGLAFQLTNFLRDIKEDFDVRSRLYVPIDDLHSFNLSEKDIREHTADDRWSQFVQFWVSRNARYYEIASDAIPGLPSYAQKSIFLALKLYRNIDEYLVQHPDVIFSRRYAIPIHRKVIARVFGI